MNRHLAQSPSLRAAGAALLAFAALGASGCGSSVDAGPTYPACSAAVEQCVDRLDVASGMAVPFYRNFSITAPSPAITEAILAVQGSERNANEVFETVEALADQEGQGDTTLVIAPHFECSDDSPPSGDLTWSCDSGTWAHGLDDESGTVSSFAVVDRFVTQLADKGTFPNLTRVVVVGMGSGGQLAQRYAATNAIDPVAGVALSYVVVSPSSYAYLDPERLPPGATCTAQGACTAAFGTFAGASSCPGFDQYGYGLEGRSGYVGVPSASEATARYVARDVSIAVGEYDTLPNALGTDFDFSCEGNAQGPDRVTRAAAFWSRVHDAYGAEHELFVVPDCAHDRACMYGSAAIEGLLFR